MNVSIRVMRPDEVNVVAALQVALFAEDAAIHDPSTNRSWPVEHGPADLADLAERDDAVVLVAAVEGAPIGFLAGLSVMSSPTRLITRHAVLRSLYVDPNHRRSKAGSALVTAFIEWAQHGGCEEVVVDHYTDNQPAADLYARHGFAAQSVTRTLRIVAT